MSKIRAISVVSTAAFVLSACAGDGVEDVEYEADIFNAAGKKIGELELESADSGGTEVEISVSGIAPGVHAMHFHETGKCDAPDYKSSGGHFNPMGVAHGNVEDGPHAGDMMNIDIGPDGSGSFEITNAKVSIRGEGGLPALADADGAALIIHALADDYESQPSGAAGARIACAVIR